MYGYIAKWLQYNFVLYNKKEVINLMKKNQGSKMCWNVPNVQSRQKVLKNIDLKSFKGTYGAKSCRCRCSCSDGY